MNRRRWTFPEAKLRKVRKIMQVPISLETPIGEEGDSHLGDFIKDSAVLAPDEAAIDVKLKEQTGRVLRTLTPREEKIIKMRFGLEDDSEHTLEEVGRAFAVTRERILQIEARACANCATPRAPSSSSHSTTYTNNAARARRARRESPGKGSRSICELT